MSGERRVAIYARVSTDEQDAAPQLERLREWAQREGFTVHMERTDVASGRRHDRGGLDEIMRAVRGRWVHAVAVVKVDRWARSVQHLSASVSEMHALGVSFHAVDQGIALRKGDANAKLTLDVLAAVAEWEVSIISERTKDALTARTTAGKPWVSKAGNKVDRLGRPAAPCHACGGDRSERPRWGKRSGKRVPLCASCKAGFGNRSIADPPQNGALRKEASGTPILDPLLCEPCGGSGEFMAGTPFAGGDCDACGGTGRVE